MPILRGEVKTSKKARNHDMTEKQNAAETPRLMGGRGNCLASCNNSLHRITAEEIHC